MVKAIETKIKSLVITNLGTTDFSIIDVADGVFEVIGTSGDNYLGGSDWDKVIAKYITDEFKKSDGIDLQKDKMAMQRIMEAAEKAKIELSSMAETTISLPFITADANGPKHLELKLTRANFENMCTELLNRLELPLKKVLDDCKFKPEDVDKVLLVGGSTRMPMIQDKIKSVMNVEPVKGINPDECVATGAAIQGAVISGDQKGIVLVDVVPLSLGVTTEGDVNVILIEKNTAIPISKKEVFSTCGDNQNAVTIEINQGERPIASMNKKLGTFVLDGILPAPRGIPKIEVAFDIDANGILNVTAKDLATQKEQHITIQSSNLSKEEIEKYKREAEMYASEDARKRELIDNKNNAEHIKYSIQKMISDYSNISAADLNELNNTIFKLDEAISTDDIEKIKSTINEANSTISAISTRIYTNSTESATADDNVVDTTATDVNDSSEFDDVFKQASNM